MPSAPSLQNIPLHTPEVARIKAVFLGNRRGKSWTKSALYAALYGADLESHGDLEAMAANMRCHSTAAFAITWGMESDKITSYFEGTSANPHACRDHWWIDDEFLSGQKDYIFQEQLAKAVKSTIAEFDKQPIAYTTYLPFTIYGR